MLIARVCVKLPLIVDVGIVHARLVIRWLVANYLFIFATLANRVSH